MAKQADGAVTAHRKTMTDRSQQHLAVQYAVARALAGTRDLDEAGPAFLGAIAHALDLDVGYSGLDYVKRFAVDALKIDRSFVAGLGVVREDTAIVSATIAFARALGLSVTAEGIETEDQLQQLIELGCETGQGYLVAAPMPPSSCATGSSSLARPDPLARTNGACRRGEAERAQRADGTSRAGRYWFGDRE